MKHPYPKDSFDTHQHALDRVGAHRAPARKGRRWIAFWWALAATALLITIGVFGLSALNERLKPDLSGLVPGTPSATPTASAAPKPTATEAAPTPTVTPTVDPSLTVTVLNGTMTIGLAGDVGEALGADGWTVGTLGDAASSNTAETVVYYAEADLEGAALGVAESLPGADILLANDFAASGADLTVVVGNDYEPAS
jgi:hypothetical protein